jgi:hypothetical protein
MSPYGEYRHLVVVNACLFRLDPFQRLFHAGHVATYVDIFKPHSSIHCDARRPELWRLWRGLCIDDWAPEPTRRNAELTERKPMPIPQAVARWTAGHPNDVPYPQDPDEQLLWLRCRGMLTRKAEAKLREYNAIMAAKRGA